MINTHEKVHPLRDEIFTEIVLIPFINFLKEFIKFGADLNGQVGPRKEHRNNKDLENAKYYISCGGYNSLHFALEKSPANLDLLKFLLEIGTDPNRINLKKVSPLFQLIKD
jgi:hypothetical protein